MKKEIRVTDEKKGIVRITTNDERWYALMGKDDATGLPTFKFLPSVTWILSIYPKLGLMRMRDEVGADEMELLKKLGGERGSKVHDAISAIIAGDEVRIDSKFVNPSTGQAEELTAEEIRHIMSFLEWQDAVKPTWLVWDVNLYSEKHGYAGTLDAIAEIEGELWLIDFKTSKVISTEYAMQVSAYRECIVNGENPILGERDVSGMKLAILQTGQAALKTVPHTYRWKPVDDCFPLFLATRQIWAEVYETQIRDSRGCSQKDYPIVLSPKRAEPEVAAVAEEKRIKKLAA